MKKITLFFIIVSGILFMNKAFSFTEMQECVRWELGADVKNKLDTAKSKEDKKKIIESYKKLAPANVPKKLDACMTLFKDYKDPKNKNLTANPWAKTVCCNCSGWCVFEWIALAYCNTCISDTGGENCCSSCNMPAAPGESCK